jgi:hypothetical protein
MGLPWTNNSSQPKPRLPQSPKAPGFYKPDTVSNHGGDEARRQFLHPSLRKVSPDWPTPRDLGDAQAD